MISVILTTYNRAHILPRAIESVLSQTYDDWELVIIDDCSQDETARVVKGYNDPRIQYFKTPVNGGSSSARNFGFEKSKGEYIVFLDDDNEFAPLFLEEAEYRLRTAHESVKGIRVGRTVIQVGYRTYAPPITHTGFDSIDWGFLMKREVMENIQYDTNIYGDEDADFGIRFAERYKQLYIDKPLIIAHGEENEDSVCNPSKRRLEGLEYFIQKHLLRYKQHPDELRYLYRLAGRNFYKAGFRLKGVQFFLKSFLARKNWRTFKHLFWILWGWERYDRFMDKEERKAIIIRV